MIYTRKQRKEIYLKAFELVRTADLTHHNLSLNKKELQRYACHAISQATNDKIDFEVIEEHFPEISIFRNRDFIGSTWLSDYDYQTHRNILKPCEIDGNELRQLILLFAAELCDDIDLEFN